VDAFAQLISSADPAMVIVTAALGDERAGCLIGFHAQSSIEPERYAVWLSKANHTFRVAQHATHLGVHFLAADQHDLAEHFGTRTGDEVDKFADVEHEDGVEGVPLLVACTNRFVARRTAMLDEGGDHVCVVCEPLVVEADGAFVPLRLGDVKDLQAGHRAEERHRPPTERSADRA